MDVVVTDKQGRPIPGLKQSDFTVMQDGKPQQVRVFEPHTGTTGGSGSAAAANAPKLPPNTYSNHPYDATADSWTIVLFDLLNTPTADQEYSRKQLLELLRNAPKGQPIALYLLTSQLVMVQGFTDDPEKLLKAAENLKPAVRTSSRRKRSASTRPARSLMPLAEATASAPAAASTTHPITR